MQLSNLAEIAQKIANGYFARGYFESGKSPHLQP